MKKPKVFLDFTSMTHPIKGKQHKTRIAKALNKLYKTKYKKVKIKYTGKSMKRYFDSYRFEFINTNRKNFKVTISINPIDITNNFFRVQLNPRAAGSKGVIRTYKLLCKVLGKSTAKKLYFESPLTRIDITFDVFGLKKPYYAYVDGMTTSEIKYGQNGRFTQIIGKGRVRLSVYDKTEEEDQHPSKSPAAFIHPNHFRYEFCLRNQRYPLSDLANKTRNPFLKLHIYNAKFLTDTYFDDTFIQQVRLEGLNKAIHELPTGAKKRRYKRRLNKLYQATWFDPEKVWKDWLQATTIFDDWRSG